MIDGSSNFAPFATFAVYSLTAKFASVALATANAKKEEEEGGFFPLLFPSASLQSLNAH
jgi:hypothetical protein